MPYRRVSALPFAAVLIAALLMSVLPATQAHALASIQIGRIQYDAPGTDTTKNVNGEYIELKNISVNPVNLTGWTVRDAHGHVYTFTSYWLGAKRSVTLHTGKGWNTLGHRYWQMGWFVWNNAKPGDTAIVRTRSGGAVDSCKYPGGAPGYKACW
jgi:hypothetical protein